VNKTLFLATCAGASAFANAWTTYSLTEIPDIPGGADRSSAQYLNDNGQVSGITADAVGERGFRWTPGLGLEPMPRLPGYDNCEAYAIDSLGNVSGLVYQTAGWVDGRGVYWKADGTLVDMGLPAGWTWLLAGGSNDQGVVVGWGQSPNGRRAFTWSQSAGYVIYDPLPGDSECGFSDISNSGVISGWSDEYAVRWSNGSPEKLELPSNASSAYPNLVTDEDRVCGYTVLGGGLYEAGTWDNEGKFVKTPQLPGFSSMDCLGVTVDGGITLGAAYAGGFAGGSLYSVHDGIVPFDSLIDASTPGWRSDLVGVANRLGQFLGWGKLNGKQRGFIATPVVGPTKATVQLGRMKDGGLHHLSLPDGNTSDVCKFIVPNPSSSPVTVEFETTAPTAHLGAYLVRVKSRMRSSGSFLQTLELYDWNAGAYSAIDQRSDALGTSFQTVELSGSGSVGRYLGPGRTLRMRLRIKATGPVGTSAWCAVLDSVQFVTRPG
jgi:hypothetical protein